MERFIVIDNVCAWPNLTLLPNGDIVLAGFNQPCHGSWEGEVACWASTDGGRSFRYRGTPRVHDPGANRMNHAAGLNADGEFVVVVSGWSDRPSKADYDTGVRKSFSTSRILTPSVCHSRDGGESWSVINAFPPAPVAPEERYSAIVPFGDIHTAADGSICVAGYCTGPVRDEPFRANCFFRSRDGGRSWDKGVFIDPAGGHGETAPLHLGGGRWLAACRQTKPNLALDLFVSEDDGRTWTLQGPLSLSYQHPAHLMRLSDGRILLTYGNRCTGMWGIDARISSDEGKTWGNPLKLVPLAKADLGYPSAVQRADGKIVTAWYASRSDEHNRYYVGVAIWDVEEFFPKGK